MTSAVVPAARMLPSRIRMSLSAKRAAKVDVVADADDGHAPVVGEAAHHLVDAELVLDVQVAGVGSSMSMTEGCWDRARAIMTRWASPPESSSSVRSAKSMVPRHDHGLSGDDGVVGSPAQPDAAQVGEAAGKDKLPAG